MSLFGLVNVLFSIQICLVLVEIILCMQYFSWKLFLPHDRQDVEDVDALTKKVE
jgi:hypothetical protein